MSQYYRIKGLKVRVSDHEPNITMDKFRGQNDAEFYVRNISGKLLSIEGQIDAFCCKNGYELSDFQEVLDDWKDGAYDVDVFKSKVEEVDEAASYSAFNDLRSSIKQSNEEKLEGYSLSPYAKHQEIKNLSEKTGVSQSFIKKFFNIR